MVQHKKKLFLFIGLGVIGCAAAIGAYLCLRNATPAEEPAAETIAVDSPALEHKALDFIKTEADIAESYSAQTIDSYYIRVNRAQNVVMVYAAGDDYSSAKPLRTFVSSVGRADSETPLGTFRVSDRYPVLFLVGDVWGRYAVRINGPYFFHSVPYFSKGPDWDDLEYLEYNKLGEGASAGCIRLAVSDAKWIYDNIPAGTLVEIYDSAELPAGVVKPSALKIDLDSPDRGWDPTDPDAP